MILADNLFHSKPELWITWLQVRLVLKYWLVGGRAVLIALRLKDTRLKKSRIPGFVGSRKKLMHNTRQSVRNRNSLEPYRGNMSCQFSIKLVQCNNATLSLR